MCRLQTWDEDYSPSPSVADTRNHPENEGDTRVEVQVAMLRAQIAGIEARVERLETRMLYLQRGFRIISALFLATLAYALMK